MIQILTISPCFLSNWQHLTTTTNHYLSSTWLPFMTTVHCRITNYHSPAGYKIIARISTTIRHYKSPTLNYKIMATQIVIQVRHWKKQGKIQIKISKCSAKVSPPTKKEPGLTTHHQRNTRFNHPPSKETGLTTYHQRNTYTHLRACTHTSIVMVTSARHLSRDLADKLTPEVCTSPSLPIHQQLFTYFHKIKSKDLHTPFSTATIVKYLRVRVTVSWGPGNVSERPMPHVNPLFSITSLEPWYRY